MCTTGDSDCQYENHCLFDTRASPSHLAAHVAWNEYVKTILYHIVIDKVRQEILLVCQPELEVIGVRCDVESVENQYLCALHCQSWKDNMPKRMAEEDGKDKQCGVNLRVEETLVCRVLEQLHRQKIKLLRVRMVEDLASRTLCLAFCNNLP